MSPWSLTTFWCLLTHWGTLWCNVVHHYMQRCSMTWICISMTTMMLVQDLNAYLDTKWAHLGIHWHTNTVICHRDFMHSTMRHHTPLDTPSISDVDYNALHFGTVQWHYIVHIDAAWYTTTCTMSHAMTMYIDVYVPCGMISMPRLMIYSIPTSLHISHPHP